MSSKLVAVDFGYQKQKYSRYSQYVRLEELLHALKVLNKRHFPCRYTPERIFVGGMPHFYLLTGCIIEVHPSITYHGNCMHWNYEKPKTIKFTAERENIPQLRCLLAKLKLPSDISLRRR